VVRLVKHAAAGAGLADVMRQTRHRSAEMALGYLRSAELWRNNVTARVFAATDAPEGA
jgi:hypothetical protein